MSKSFRPILGVVILALSSISLVFLMESTAHAASIFCTDNGCAKRGGIPRFCSTGNNTPCMAISWASCSCKADPWNSAKCFCKASL